MNRFHGRENFPTPAGKSHAQNRGGNRQSHQGLSSGWQSGVVLHGTGDEAALGAAGACDEPRRISNGDRHQGSRGDDQRHHKTFVRRRLCRHDGPAPVLGNGRNFRWHQAGNWKRPLAAGAALKQAAVTCLSVCWPLELAAGDWRPLAVLKLQV